MPPRACAIPARRQTGSRCARPRKRNAFRPAFMSALTAAGNSPGCNGCSDISRLTDVSLLTGHELEFLASLNTRWRRLYCNELERLLKGDDTRCDGRHEPPSIIPIS